MRFVPLALFAVGILWSVSAVYQFREMPGAIIFFGGLGLICAMLMAVCFKDLKE